MNGREELVDAYLRLHPDGAARLLESLTPEQGNEALSTVAVETAAAVVGRMLPTHAARCLETKDPPQAAELLEKLGSQEAVAVLRHLPPGQKDAVIASLGPQWVIAFRLLLSYPTSTVGAWIEPRVLTLADDCTAGEARDRVARSDQVTQARVYVLDRSRHVRGAVRGISLLQVPGRKRLTAILEPAETLWARDPLATAQDHAVWERHTEAPVVNRDEEFVGVISYADLRRAFKQVTRAPGEGSERELSEVTELIAIGAGSLWQSLGDWIGNERER